MKVMAMAEQSYVTSACRLLPVLLQRRKTFMITLPLA